VLGLRLWTVEKDFVYHARRKTLAKFK
jgi:hypothetical protein